MAALELGPQGLTSRVDWREGLPLMVTPRVVLRELRRSDAPRCARWRVRQRWRVTRGRRRPR